MIELDCAALQENNAASPFIKHPALLFIDHPGLGWHDEPNNLGIDRRGISGGLNVFFIIAAQSYSRLCIELSEQRESREVDKLIQNAQEHFHRLFWDDEHAIYADAIVNGRRSTGISQQINALAVLTDVCPAHLAKQVLSRILKPDNTSVCQCTPYFWFYLFLAMHKADMHVQIIENMKTHWGAMLKQAATTWWETFLGNDKDSLCHIWSSSPSYVLQSFILGVYPHTPGFGVVEVTPQIDLLEHMDGSVVTPTGTVHVSSTRESHTSARLKVRVDGDMLATVQLPQDWCFDGTNTAQRQLMPHSGQEWPVRKIHRHTDNTPETLGGRTAR